MRDSRPPGVDRHPDGPRSADQPAHVPNDAAPPDPTHYRPQWPHRQPPLPLPGPSLQPFRRRPPHPDDFLPAFPAYLEHYADPSPEISPLAQTTYPLYPIPPDVPLYPPHPERLSPTHSVATTPSPFGTPGTNFGSIPLPSLVPMGFEQQIGSHDIMFNAVESARWTSGVGASYPDPHHMVPLPMPPPPPAPPPHPPTIPGPVAAVPSDASTSSTATTWAHSRGEDEERTSPAGTIKPFIDKLYTILSQPGSYGDCIKWNDDGDSFFVAHTDKLTRTVLPEYFEHSNIHSFTRQLNVYSFTRMTVRQLREGLSIPSATTADYSGWSHPNFRRGESSLLALLAPRPSRARLLKKLEKQYASKAS
ncbi:hypothetical protein JCM10212_004750 [Sporobolomyces blumeae]